MHRGSRNKACLPRQGFGIFEIIIASAIIVGAVVALINILVLSKYTAEFSTQKIQAAFLLEEGVEAVKFIRDTGWNQNIVPLLINTDYYLVFSTSTSVWTIGSAPIPAIDGIFTRSFRVEHVSRDASSNIETSYNPANLDLETKKIIMRVTWPFKGQNKTATLETYLVDLFDN